jgi:hypothetical protein
MPPRFTGVSIRTVRELSDYRRGRRRTKTDVKGQFLQVAVHGAAGWRSVVVV